MNKLVKIREKILKANSLHESQLLATKNGKNISYRRSVYEERVKKTFRHISS